jgi:hemolysin activation/secretion protein
MTGRMRRALVGGAFAALVVAEAAAALAQQAPDAGRLLQDTRPVPTLPLRKAPKIDIQEPPAAAAADAQRIHVTSVRITGATSLPQPELHGLVADAEGKDLSLAELRALADRVTRHYRSRGYLLARAYVPAQEIVDGQVQLAVLEGRLGEVRIDDAAGLRGAALAPLRRLRSGEAARSDQLERSLLLLSDLPGLEVKSTLRPGATPGASDLLVEVGRGRRITGRVDLDNYGNRFSGEYRLGGTLDFNNPLRLGDQATVRALASDERMAYVRGSYQLPVNALGTRVGVAMSEMRYRLGRELAPLDAHGNAQTASVYAQHPLVRSRALNLSAQAQYDRLRLGDRVDATGTRVDKRLDVGTLAFTGDFQDPLAGVNQVSVGYSTGHLKLDPVTRTLDEATARTGGGFTRANLAWLRLQRFGALDTLSVSMAAQFASKNLDSTQKMALGGAFGVRAYPQDEAPGDEGALATVELRHNLPASAAGLWQLTAFVDAGHVKSNRNPWTAAANSRTLSGAGLGAIATFARDWRLDASLAWKLGNTRAVSDTDRSPRLWLRLTGSF